MKHFLTCFQWRLPAALLFRRAPPPPPRWALSDPTTLSLWLTAPRRLRWRPRLRWPPAPLASCLTGRKWKFRVTVCARPPRNQVTPSPARPKFIKSARRFLMKFFLSAQTDDFDKLSNEVVKNEELTSKASSASRMHSNRHYLATVCPFFSSLCAGLLVLLLSRVRWNGRWKHQSRTPQTNKTKQKPSTCVRVFTAKKEESNGKKMILLLPLQLFFDESMTTKIALTLSIFNGTIFRVSFFRQPKWFISSFFGRFFSFQGEQLNKKKQNKTFGYFQKKIVPKKETIVDTLRTAHVFLRLSRDSISLRFVIFSESIYRFGWITNVEGENGGERRRKITVQTKKNKQTKN